MKIPSGLGRSAISVRGLDLAARCFRRALPSSSANPCIAMSSSAEWPKRRSCWKAARSRSRGSQTGSDTKQRRRFQSCSFDTTAWRLAGTGQFDVRTSEKDEAPPGSQTQPVDQASDKMTNDAMQAGFVCRGRCCWRPHFLNCVSAIGMIDASFQPSESRTRVWLIRNLLL